MPFKRTEKIAAGFLIAIWVIIVSAPFVFADSFTSTNFTNRNPTTDFYGGNGSSTNFSATMSGEAIEGTKATSTNFVLNSGFQALDTFSPQSMGWRWYDDETSETPVTPLAGENVSPSGVSDLNLLKLRVAVHESAGVAEGNVKFALQYSTSSDFSTGAYFVTEQSSCTGSSQWCYADGAGVDNALITTKVLSGSDACASSVGDGCGTHNESGTSTSAFTHKENATTEYEFTLEPSGTSASTVYFFRLFDVVASSSVPVGSSTYPSVSMGGGTLSFAISGLATTTSTGGVTTDISTSPSNVPFGSLAVSAPVIGAHRLTVSTNAAQGYEIFAYQPQGFLGSGAEEIPPVAGTNTSPLSWAGGCAATSTGCYGYHTTESVLAGGSTRFAANDTYAQFRTSPDEVAYSVGPATDRTTDLVYKVEVHDQQAADAYSSSVVYIVVPTF